MTILFSRFMNQFPAALATADPSVEAGSERAELSVRSENRVSTFPSRPYFGVFPAPLFRLRRKSFIFLAAKPILITDY